MTDLKKNQDTVLVAEYTLGLMDPTEAESFAKKITQDSTLKAEYIRWSEHFNNLANEIEEVEPPARLKADIYKRLFSEAETDSTESSWFNFRWAGALVFTSVLAVMLYLNMPASFSPGYTAQLSSEEINLSVTALYDQQQQSLKMTNFTGIAAPGRDFELWLIVADNAPVSLGVLAASTSRNINIPSEFAASVNGATLALSDEPVGGSPTGSPTGEVLVAATVEAI